MEKSSGAAAGGSAPPSPFQMKDFQLEGKKPVKNPFVPIGATRPLLPTLAVSSTASSTASWSPPEVRQYNRLCTRKRHICKMSDDRAHWDVRTIACLLELCLQQKGILNWQNKAPTSIGWTNIYNSFNATTQLGYSKRQLQNKFQDLKRGYFNWRGSVVHTGLGRDPVTGEVTYDPLWVAAISGDVQMKPGCKYKRPPCCELLYNLFGHEPLDRGELVSAGGIGTEPPQTETQTQPHPVQSPTDGSPHTPQAPISHGPSLKRPLQEASVSMPNKKISKPKSLEDALEQFSNYLQGLQDKKPYRPDENEELDQVVAILESDGFTESDPFFMDTMIVCMDRTMRRGFLRFRTQEGRTSFVTRMLQKKSPKTK